MKKNRQNRREGALARLEDQLEAGTKTAKKGTNKIPLTDTDKKRITKQIGVLNKPYTGYHANNRKHGPAVVQQVDMQEVMGDPPQ